MTSSMTGAPTPAVYWRRRLFVVGVLLALVLIVVNVVGGGSDPQGGVRAATAGSEESLPAAPESPGTSGTTSAGPTTGKRGRNGAGIGPMVVLPTAPVLAEPEGECADSDVNVTPTVKRAVAGRTAVIVLELRTLTNPACTWQVTPESLAVRVSVGDDVVWASWECPAALPVLPVVVRSAVTSTYELRWNTRRSDKGCPQLTEYAQPGDYRVTAGSFGGEPEYVIFDLAAPSAPEPEPEPEKEKGQRQKGQKQKAGAGG